VYDIDFGRRNETPRFSPEVFRVLAQPASALNSVLGVHQTLAQEVGGSRYGWPPSKRTSLEAVSALNQLSPALPSFLVLGLLGGGCFGSK
jgi:hypothetical protein